VVALEREHWEQWLHGSPADAAALIRLPPTDLYAHGAADPEKHVPLPVAA
jgi:putative SOS response-associated peptidase YedK